MKFLLELFSCCGCQKSRGVDTPVPERQSDTSSLVPVVRRSLRQRRRGRFNSDDSGREDDWRPSLCAISEDSVAVERDKSQKTESGNRVVKRKSDECHQERLRVHSYNKNFGNYNTFPTFIPAFSPTPFMF